VLLVIIFGIFILLLFVLVALLPAIIIAQDRYGIHSTLYPELISSSKPAVYGIVWGIPVVVYLIYELTKHSILKTKSALLLSFHLILPYILWLCQIQLSINKKATFRTDIGLILCYPVNLAAGLFFGVSIAGMFGCLVMDLAVCLKPSVLDD